MNYVLKIVCRNKAKNHVKVISRESGGPFEGGREGCGWRTFEGGRGVGGGPLREGGG